jgi:membrane fusion protein (multidrug efflux system)
VSEAEAGIRVAESRLAQAQAGEQQARAELRNAQTGPQQVAGTKARADAADARVKQAQATLEQAELNLQYTTVKAPVRGIVSRKNLNVGQVVQPGQPLLAIVPTEEIWVTANFKETQLDSMRPGQPVTLTIDAYPERAIRGHVASIQSGSGPAFSLLPPENATGNWVKIVQRVPVKIVLDNPPTDVALGPGMSVETSVRINPHPSLYEKLRSSL